MNLDEFAKRLTDLENKVDQIEVRLSSVEESVTTTLDLFGNYKNRTIEELSLMGSQIANLISIVESLVSRAENQDATERAKSLRRRLLNNQTRINKQLKKKQNHG